MKWLGVLLAIAFIALSSVLNKKLKQKNQHVKDGTIKQPCDYLFVGILGVVAFVAVALIFFIAQHDIVAGVAMIAISIPYMLLIIYTAHWEIRFDSNGFLFTNIIRRRTYYLYSSVTIENTGRGLRIYAGKKQIAALPFSFANVDDFYQRYTDFHNK